MLSLFATNCQGHIVTSLHVYTNHLLSVNRTTRHICLMTNTDTRNSRDSMSQTSRSSFTPLPLINKAITDSQRHNYAVITQNNRFSLSTFPTCFTRVPPQITTTPTSPLLARATVNPLHSLNTLACTKTTWAHTHR